MLSLGFLSKTGVFDFNFLYFRWDFNFSFIYFSLVGDFDFSLSNISLIGVFSFRKSYFSGVGVFYFSLLKSNSGCDFDLLKFYFLGEELSDFCFFYLSGVLLLLLDLFFSFFSGVLLFDRFDLCFLSDMSFDMASSIFYLIGSGVFDFFLLSAIFF